MKDMEGRRAIGPDGVLRHILKECRQQLTEPVQEILECLLNTGRIPKEGKGAHIIPIYKTGIKRNYSFIDQCH